MSCMNFDTVYLTIGSTRVVSFNVSDSLPSGVSVSAVSSVSDVTDGGSATGDLTISSVQVNSATYTERHTGDTVAIGAAIQWLMSTSATEEKDYLLKITYVTDGSPAETITDYLNVKYCKAD